MFGTLYHLPPRNFNGSRCSHMTTPSHWNWVFQSRHSTSVRHCAPRLWASISIWSMSTTWTNAAKYDLLHEGSLVATMADINTFSNADKVSMPTNPFHVASAFQQYRIRLHMLHKNTHPLTMEEFDRFCIPWNREEADMDELRETTPYFAALPPLAPSPLSLLVLRAVSPRRCQHGDTAWNSFRRSSFRSSGARASTCHVLRLGFQRIT
jgi:hypothetical protein